MKKLQILYIIFLLFILNKSYSNPFEIIPLNVHFFDCVSSGQNILTYGTSGAYLMTTDKGKSWNQYSIGCFEDIMKMVNYNDTLWCITESGYIFKSVNNGLSWLKSKIQLDDKDYLINIEVSDDYLYLRTQKSIKKYDKSFKLLNNYSESSIYSIKENNQNNLPFYNFYIGNFFKFLDNKLICSQNPYKGFEVLILDENLNKIKEINTKEFINRKAYGYGSYYYILKDIYLINEEIVFNFLDNLYITNKTFSKWEYFYSDTNYMNIQDTSRFKSNYMYNLNYAVNNYELYQSELKYGNINPIKDSLWVCKYSNSTNLFNRVNNCFASKYSDITFEKNHILRLTTTFDWGKMYIFYDSIYIYIANNKSILQSKDYCKNWELVSNFVINPINIINDSTYNNLFSLQSDKNSIANTIYTTLDGGQTFQPTIFKDTSKIAIRSYKPTIFHINKNGKGLFAGSANDLGSKGYHLNLAFTNDFGKSFVLKKDLNLSVGYTFRESKSSNFIESDNSFLFAVNIGEARNVHFNYLYRYNFIDNMITMNILDSLFKVNYIIAKDLKNFKMFVTENDSEDTNRNNFAIYETNDSGKTHTTIFKSEFNYNFDQFLEYSMNLLLFTCKNDSKLYTLDINTNSIETIFEEKNADSIKIFKISDKIFLCGDGFLYENTNKTNVKEWSKINWNYGTPKFETVIFNDNTAIATFSDSLRNKNYFKFTLKNQTDIIENPNVEVIKYTKSFYASNPYPLPTASKVSAILSFDLSYDIWESIDGIYDIYGSKIEGKENINITFESKYTAKLEWNSNSVINGTYYILIKHNGTIDCIPIVVYK